MSIRVKIIGLLVGLFVCCIAVNAVFISNSQYEQAESQMLNNARIISAEASATWDFIDMNQDRIDTDRDGVKSFKGIYCAVAGRGVSLLFMEKTDYVLRYVSSDPRNPVAIADDFESNALRSFENGNTEYYGSSYFEDSLSFRYSAPIYIKDSCLTCHGEPAGEIDATGRPKEGMKEGDLAGAISIVIPSDLYVEDIKQNITEQTIFFTIVMMLILLLVFFAMEILVSRPVQEMNSAINSLKKGIFRFELKHCDRKDEMGSIARELQDMASQLHQTQLTLENKVIERTSELEKVNKILLSQSESLQAMNETLNREVAYKSDFLTIMGHELKTPLTAILAYVELWEAEADDSNSAIDIDSLHEVKANAQILLQMIVNILETAQIEEGRSHLNLSYVDVGDTVRSVVDRLSFLSSQKNITVTTKISSDVSLLWADEDKLRRIIENLLSNAIKYTQESGSISITAMKDSECSSIQLKVADNGCGIARENLCDIFNRFTRFCGDKRIGGSGLGLSVARELTEMHGGSITVESELGLGSTFTVVIPERATSVG